MSDRSVVCNLNFHTSVGGTQHTLVTILSILARHYTLRIVDPYQNPEFTSLLSAVGLEADRVVDLSDRTYLSLHRGFRRALDSGLVSPRYVRAALAFGRFCSDQRVDLVYTNQTKGALFAAAAARVPILYHCHGATARGIRAIALLGGRISHVIANSSFTGGELERKGFSPERLTVITNTVPVTEIRSLAAQGPAVGLPPVQCTPVILLAHAGIEPNKGTILGVEAMGTLRDRGLAGELWIAGDVPPAYEDYAQRVKRLVAELDLQERVHFLGKRADIYAVMDRADIILVPSLIAESFGRVVAEAMVLGKPVVVSNRGALPSLVQECVTGRVFDPCVPGALGELLCELAGNAGLQSQYGRAGMALAGERFDLAAYEDRLLSVFSRALSAKDGRPLAWGADAGNR